MAVKISALSLIKELCSSLHKVLGDSEETSAHANIILFVQEVSVIIHLYIFPCNMFKLLFMYLVFLTASVQLFHSVAPQVVECISTIKVGQVCDLFPLLVYYYIVHITCGILLSIAFK